MEVPLGTECHAGNALVVALEETVCHAMHHAIHEDRVRIHRIDLLGPGASLGVLGTIPHWQDPLSHEEEHARLPNILGNAVDDIPELGCILDDVHALVALERVVVVVGVVIPESPHLVLLPLNLVLKTQFRFYCKYTMSGEPQPPSPPRKGPPPGVSPAVAGLREKVKTLEEMLDNAMRQSKEIDALAAAYEEAAGTATDLSAQYRLCDQKLKDCEKKLPSKAGTRRRRHRKRTSRVPRK